MQDEDCLKRNNWKEWWLCLLLGFFIGLAVIVPGISGATIAIIFGLYAKLLYSFGNIFKQFKKCFVFLLPVAIGVVLGFAIGFLAVQKLIQIAPFIIICMFAGLMIGSFPAVKDEIKGVKFDKSKIILLVLGVIIPIVIGVVSIALNNSSGEPLTANIWTIILFFILGFILSFTQLLPGLSCSAILMAMGLYGAIISAVHLDYLIKNPLVILALISLALGFVLGFVVFSKVISKFLKKKRDETYSLIVGMTIGSIVSMFLNPEIWAVYTSWSGARDVLFDVLIGAVLLIIGMVGTYCLVRYQRKHKKD